MRERGRDRRQRRSSPGIPTPARTPGHERAPSLRGFGCGPSRGAGADQCAHQRYLAFLAWQLWNGGTAAGTPAAGRRQVLVITLFNPKALVLAFAAFPETRDLAAAAILMLVFVLTATATGASWTLVGTWLRHGRLRDRGDCVAQLRTIGDSVTGVTGPARPAWESAVVAMTAAPPRLAPPPRVSSTPASRRGLFFAESRTTPRPPARPWSFRTFRRSRPR